MTSQTRLTMDQMEILQDMQKQYEQEGVKVFHFPTLGTGVCVAIKQTGIDTAKFAISIASCEESVYRYDVAEYVVFGRWDSLEVLPCNIKTWTGEYPRDILGEKAYVIALAVA